jgi:hypothetical protein
MSDEEAWAIEESLWLKGPTVYDALLDRQCVIAFSAPVGLLQGHEILESLKGAPRWAEVAMTERTVSRPDAGTVVLGYRARSQRTGAEPYSAYCTSTYRYRADAWLLIQHQQTPVPECG